MHWIGSRPSQANCCQIRSSVQYGRLRPNGLSLRLWMEVHVASIGMSFHLLGFCCFNIFWVLEFIFFYIIIRTILLCIVGVLAGEEFLTLAVGVSVMWQATRLYDIWCKIGFLFCPICPFLSDLILVLLSGKVERISVSCLQDLKKKNKTINEVEASTEVIVTLIWKMMMMLCVVIV